MKYIKYLTKWIFSDICNLCESWKIKNLQKRNKHQQEMLEDAHKNNQTLRDKVTELQKSLTQRNRRIKQLEKKNETI